MLRTTSKTQSSAVLLVAINMAEDNEIGSGGGNGMKSMITPKKFIGVDYPNFEGTVGARSFEYLTPNAKKAFNHLRHLFIKASIFQHFDLEHHIWVETDVSGHVIGGVLS